MKYYMNAPCRVVREISDDFSEIQVFPKFRDDLNGRMWCTECMVGNQGTPSTHTCEEYQEVIDALEDVENSMLVIVENRLIADEPIEFKKIVALSLKIDSMEKDLADKSKALASIVSLTEGKREELVQLENKIDRNKEVISEYTGDIEELSNRLLEIRKQYTITAPSSVELSKEEYEKLVKRDFILTKLEAGGVDNWEWYGESYPTDDEISKIV